MKALACSWDRRLFEAAKVPCTHTADHGHRLQALHSKAACTGKENETGRQILVIDREFA